MTSMKHTFTQILLLAAVSFAAGGLPAADLDFNRDIRPILSDKCYFCHGPDDENREAGLRFDIREEAIDAIEAGELVDRIDSDDPDMIMPPPRAKLPLTEKEKRLLEQWVEQGAPYAGHWAFEKLPLAVDVPRGGDSDWPRETLDRFVLAKLNEQGLSPSDEADPARWLRRVTLDLTGLPPTLEQIRSFDESLRADPQHAYQDVVDRLLASTAFGEQMAVAWLDAARYADSYGYQSDKLNTQWPYRDWVVDAFNDNLPYDQFLTWQLAGDLLENPTREQRVATAFNRIHRLNNEGGAVFEEWRLENVADRVHTFGTAVLGLTMECCRCHDHKYDPIPMRDYYSLSAYFNSIDESGVYDRTEKVPCPSLLLPTADQEAALQDAKQRILEAEKESAKQLAEAKKRYQQWAPEPGTPLEIPDLRIALAFDQDFDNSIKEIYHPSESDRSWTQMPSLVAVEDSPVERLENSIAADARDGDTPPTRRALQLDGERGVTVHGIEPFDRWLPMSVVVTFRETVRSPQRSLIAHHTRGTDCGYNGWDLTIEDGHLESRMARVWPGNAISVRTTEPIAVDRWHQVTATYDGSSRAAGLKLYLNGEELESQIVRDRLKKRCNVKVDHGGEFVVGQRFRARGLAGGLIDDVRVYDRELTTVELKTLAFGQQPFDADKPGFSYYASAIDEKVRAAMSELTEARKAFVMAEEVMDEIPIMEESETPRFAHVLARGEYDAPKNSDTLVNRQTLSGIEIAMPEDAPNNRLGLARWVTDPQHPLTARVAVNRFWGNFFTSPLVRTPENFGSQGDLPTHPELLDWLSRDFVDSGWDVKRLCKSIVLSSTYRQDSSATPDRLAADPDNQWLSRGPAHRLGAEQIRDLALAASGLLDRELGGPPVSPYQPGDDLWKESNGMSPPYQQSVGKALYRRSLYSVWKRTAPLPNMMAFDTTTREVCTVERSRTNTPLQALVLLNDVQFIEASRVLAADLAEQPTGEQLENAFLRLTGRTPDQVERQRLGELLADEEAYYAAHPDAAEKLLELGDAELNPDVDVAKLAALTNVCQAILNLDATIWKR
ncbi:Planctomycete cytochrome C [Stieleria magnilauensis]|uniref:Planctomycete cytochrome C n=2 Tax=Stieleria magnilauensis TaxID=2527963 RepID=A0ABX5XJE1_9BACT|nr:Planctomycete cytochrome C [Planctomycetes bacterium TBK1r]